MSKRDAAIVGFYLYKFDLENTLFIPKDKVNVVTQHLCIESGQEGCPVAVRLTTNPNMPLTEDYCCMMAYDFHNFSSSSISRMQQISLSFNICLIKWL